jgi:hypothetical protein
MNVQLKSVVALPDEMHTILEVGNKHKVEVFPDTRVYFKTKVGRINPPAKLLIQTAKGQEMYGHKQSLNSVAVDLQVWYGNTYAHCEPSERSHFLHFANPVGRKELHAYPAGSFKFSHEFLYLGMLSQSGCIITIEVIDEEIKDKVVKRREISEWCYSDVVAPATDNFFITKNMAIAKQFNRYNTIATNNKSKIKEHRTIIATCRKQIIDQEQRKYKQFLMIRSEIMKAKKKEIQAAIMHKVSLQK